MKIPNLLTLRQALILSALAFAIGLSLKIFGAVVIWIVTNCLFGIAVIALVYAGVSKWLPDLIDTKPKG